MNEIEYDEIDFKQYAIDCIHTYFEYDPVDVQRWIARLEIYRRNSYKDFMGGCVIPTYNKYSERIIQLQHKLMESQEQIIRNRGYALCRLTGKAFEGVTLFVAAAQMANEQKRDRRFFDKETLQPILIRSMLNAEIFIFGPEEA